MWLLNNRGPYVRLAPSGPENVWENPHPSRFMMSNITNPTCLFISQSRPYRPREQHKPPIYQYWWHTPVVVLVRNRARMLLVCWSFMAQVGQDISPLKSLAVLPYKVLINIWLFNDCIKYTWPDYIWPVHIHCTWLVSDATTRLNQFDLAIHSEWWSLVSRTSLLFVWDVPEANNMGHRRRSTWECVHIVNAGVVLCPNGLELNKG
jgi:hypothetical protein